MEFLQVSGNAAPVDKVRAKEHFHDGATTFYSKVKGIKKQIEKGRYSRYAIIESGKKSVNYFVYYDYSVYRRLLENEYTSKSVPPFNPREIAEIVPTMIEHHFHD